MADLQKCAHPVCECMIDGKGEFGKYCSQACETAGDILELKCDCGHPGCAESVAEKRRVAPAR
jgi:hypothetical protein